MCRWVSSLTERMSAATFHLAQLNIARHKAPRELFLVLELPRTSGGKLKRSALR